MADVHQHQATTWSLYHEGPTSATGDVGATTEPLDVQGQRSNSRDQDWDNFMRSLEQQGQEASSTDNMDLLFGLENLPAHFGALNGMSDFEPASTTTSDSSLSSSMSDPNSATHPFQTWPTMPSSQQMPSMEYQQHVIQPGNWVPQHHFQPASSFSMHGPEGLGIHMMPTSHPIEQREMQFHEVYPDHRSPVHLQHGFNPDLANGWEQQERNMPPREEHFCDDDDRESTDPADPCYAQLLYQCLKEAPGYTLSLRELYEWVSQHSQKAKDPKNRGWQNSVRHNLSMNAAFARVPHGQHTGPKKGSLWRLTDEALRDGVISTTRYRKDPKRKPERRAFPALNRQASGAKGGRATRDATRLRQQQQQQQRAHGLPIATSGHRFRRYRHGPQYSPYSAHSRSLEASPQPGFNPLPPTPQGASPYFIDEPCGYPPLPMSAPQTPPPGATSMEELQELNFDNAHKNYSNLEFLPLDSYNGGPNGLFGNHDPEVPQHDPDTPTPSLMTEASFMTDDNLPSAVMAHAQRDDGTGF